VCDCACRGLVVHVTFVLISHPDFNRYAKCNFRITRRVRCGPAGDACGESCAAPHFKLATFDVDSTVRVDACVCAGGVLFFVCLILVEWIVCRIQWDEVESRMGQSGGRPMVHGSLSNPFGASYLYAFPGMVVEVMKNGHIATVTLFDDHCVAPAVLASAVSPRRRRSSLPRSERHGLLEDGADDGGTDAQSRASSPSVPPTHRDTGRTHASRVAIAGHEGLPPAPVAAQ